MNTPYYLPTETRFRLNHSFLVEGCLNFSMKGQFVLHFHLVFVDPSFPFSLTVDVSKTNNKNKLVGILKRVMNIAAAVHLPLFLRIYHLFDHQPSSLGYALVVDFPTAYSAWVVVPNPIFFRVPFHFRQDCYLKMTPSMLTQSRKFRHCHCH